MSKETGAYVEIMNALAFYFSDGALTPSSEQIHKEIREEFDPIGTIAAALNDFRESNK